MKQANQLGRTSEAGASAFIGLDIGNTRLTGCASTGDGQLLWWRERPAPSDCGADAAVPVLLELADQARSAATTENRLVRGVGLGFGGPVDYERRVTRQSFHSPGWEDLPLAEIFERELALPVSLDNDANAGGLGEALFGAALGHRALLYVNVGTGVGGAVVIGGTAHRGATGSAGEIGHVVVDPDGRACNCGKRGCVESIVSGTGMARAAAEAGLANMSGRDVVGSAAAGDLACAAIVRRSAETLGLTIANAANVLDPDIVVLGGGVPESGEIWLAPLRDSFARHAVGPIAQATRIVAAGLGYHAGVLGAAALAVEAWRASGEA